MLKLQVSANTEAFSKKFKMQSLLLFGTELNIDKTFLESWL